MISKDVFKAIYLRGRFDKYVPEPKCVDDAWADFQSLASGSKEPADTAAVALMRHALERAKWLYDELSLGPLGAAAKYGPDYESPTEDTCLEIRGLIEDALKTQPPCPAGRTTGKGRAEEPPQICPSCEGTGKRHRTNEFMETCTSCNGTGKLRPLP